MITAPLMTSCGSDEIPTKFMMFTIVASTNTPMTQLSGSPLPPTREAPPTTTAAMASSSYPRPINELPCVNCAAASSPAKPASTPG